MKTEKAFKNTGETFSAINKAREWAKKQGYCTGSMQLDYPIGLKKGCDHIPKWTNMSTLEQAQLEGTISPVNGFREGDAVVTIY